jgi:pimeloyl-ACP methyl ester carboxylesterase
MGNHQLRLQKMQVVALRRHVSLYRRCCRLRTTSKVPYASGRLRSIMIVGHSLGGGAAVLMAAELGRASVPVDLVILLDPVGGSQVSANVRRSLVFVPGPGQDHFSVIAVHERDLANYVLGANGSGGARR